MGRFGEKKIKKIIGIVQARAGSSRFPRKMLHKLGHLSVLEWVLQRLKKASMLSEVVLATTTCLMMMIEKIAYQCGVNVYRGSESNVLSRFAEAANLYGAEIVVRVCGDNAIDHKEIDRLINFYINNPCDYAFNHQNRLNSGYRWIRS